MIQLLVRRTLVAGLSLLVATTLFVSTASADLIVDTFDTVVPLTWPVIQTVVGSTPTNETGLPLTETLGGVRQTTTTADSLAILGLDNVTTNIMPFPPSLLDYASSAGADGSLNLLYDAGGVVDGLNVDFSTETGITMDFLLFDHAGGVDMPVTVTIGDGTNVATLTHTLTSAGAQQLLFDFDDFAGIGSVDMTSIDFLNFFFDAQLAHDFRLDFLATTSNVPEPASLLVWGMAGIVGLLVHRRYRRAAA